MPCDLREVRVLAAAQRARRAVRACARRRRRGCASAPRCTAGEIGAAWRIEPSPKYSVRPSIGSAMAGKTNGIADDAIRCGTPIAVRTAMRCERVQGRMSCDRVVEGHVQAGAVARGGDRKRLQVALAHHLVQALGADHALQQQRCGPVVEQRLRPRTPPARDDPADRHHRQPACAGADHADRVGPVDLLGAEVLPDLGERAHAGVEVGRAAGERGRVDRASRRAGDDRERVARRRDRLAPDLRHRLEHADLVGRTRATAREHEAGGGRQRLAHAAYS